LFNEAKLLKCLGQLCLLIVDEKLPNIRFEHDEGFTEHDVQHGHYPGFTIDRHHDGSFFAINLRFYDQKGYRVVVYSALNSKEPYPLLFTDRYGTEAVVFHDDGTITDEFVEYIAAEGIDEIPEDEV